MFKKLITTLIIISVLLSCTSCINRDPHPDEVREQFSTLTPKNQVCISTYDSFYTGNRVFSHDELISCLKETDDVSVVVCTLYDSKIYTLAEVTLDKNSLHIYVVEFDVASNSSTLVFESDIICSWGYAYRGSNGILGIYSTAGNKEYYYSYVIETGEFIKDKVDDEQFDINIYNKELFNAEKGGFTITDRETGVTKKVNADTISASVYADCFSNLYYYPSTYSQYGDTIVLAFSISSSVNHGFISYQDGYFYACFTYDFETETLEFDSLLYTNEGEGADFSYNAKSK